MDSSPVRLSRGFCCGFCAPTDTAPIRVAGDKNIVLGLNGLMVVVLGVIPGPLLDACMHAMSKTLAS